LNKRRWTWKNHRYLTLIFLVGLIGTPFPVISYDEADNASCQTFYAVMNPDSMNTLDLLYNKNNAFGDIGQNINGVTSKDQVNNDEIILSGHVFVGEKADTSNPADLVSLRLFPSINPDSYHEGEIIQETSTNNAGFYLFTFTPAKFGIDLIMPEFYHISLFLPEGSNSITADSSSGSIVSPTQIVFRYPFSDPIFENNDFWILYPPKAAFETDLPSGTGTVPLNVHFSDTSGNNPSSWAWDFGDGTTSSLQNPQHTYTVPGIYLVKLATSNSAGSNSIEKTIVAQGEPVLEISPISGKTGTIVTATGSFFIITPDLISDTELIGEPVADVYIDKLLLLDDTPISDDGSFTITLTIPGDTGQGPHEIRIINGKKQLHATFTITNNPPKAIIHANPLSGITPLHVYFSAHESRDPDGTITDYLWDFGDNTSSSEAIVNHSYIIPGRYLTKLTVVDDAGQSGSASKWIQADNSPPVAVVVMKPGSDPFTFRFDGSQSYDPDGIITSYFWDLGDGDLEYSKVFSHAYKNKGTYFAKLTVTDDQGRTGQKIITLKTGNRPPVASFTLSPDERNAPLNIIADGSRSYDPDNDSLSFSWSFGDETSGTGDIVHHLYNKEGKYEITLTVTDTGGLSNSRTELINVDSPFPLLILIIVITISGVILSGISHYNNVKKRKNIQKMEDETDEKNSHGKDEKYPDLHHEIESGLECKLNDSQNLPDIHMDIRSGIVKDGEET